MATKRMLRIAFVLATLSAHVSPSIASVIIGGTRVVFDAKQREVTVKLTNEGDQPALVQAWLDDGDPKTRPDNANVPFALSPPLSRIDPAKGQTIRIVRVDNALPTDRESLFWLNVLEIPPRPAKTGEEQNILQLAFRSRIKVFYRPEGLDGNAEDAASHVTWRAMADSPGHSSIEVSNPTPYHVTLTKITVHLGANKFDVPDAAMVKPNAKQRIETPGFIPSGSQTLVVEYTFVNDYGASVDGKYEANNTP